MIPAGGRAIVTVTRWKIDTGEHRNTSMDSDLAIGRAYMSNTSPICAEKSPVSTAAIVTRPATVRSRATNGSSLFAQGGDNRSAWARRLRDVLELHVSDLGGSDAISEAEKSIARRASVLTVELERIEAAFAEGKGEPGTLDLYQRTTNTLRRTLEAVGLERRQKDVTPSLQQYIASKARAGASA